MRGRGTAGARWGLLNPGSKGCAGRSCGRRGVCCERLWLGGRVVLKEVKAGRDLRALLAVLVAVTVHSSRDGESKSPRSRRSRLVIIHAVCPGYENSVTTKNYVVIQHELVNNQEVFHEFPADLYIPLGKKGWSVRAVSSPSGSFTCI